MDESEAADSRGDDSASGEDLTWLEAIDWGDDRASHDSRGGEAVSETDYEGAAGVEANADADSHPGEPQPTTDGSGQLETVAESGSAAANRSDGADVPTWMAWTSEDDQPAGSGSDDGNDVAIVEIEALLATPESVGDHAHDSVEIDAGERHRDDPAAAGLAADEVLPWEDPTDALPAFAAVEGLEASVEDPGEAEPSLSGAGRGEESALEPIPEHLAGGESAEGATAPEGHVPDRAIEELAARLETLAGSLRTRTLTEVVAGASSSDPLEVLLAGYALGFARGRSDAGGTAD